MRKLTGLISAVVIVGSLAMPFIALGACGNNPLCAECVTEQTCEAKTLCVWADATCSNMDTFPITSGNITTMLGYAGQLFTDFSALILVAIGLPVGFWIIKKAISLVKAK
jgi:hypothetical protein